MAKNTPVISPLATVGTVIPSCCPTRANDGKIWKAPPKVGPPHNSQKRKVRRESIEES